MNYKYINLTKYAKSTINNTLTKEILYEHIEKLEAYIAKFDKGLSIDKDLKSGFLIEHLSVCLEFTYSLRDTISKDHVLLYCNLFKTRIDELNNAQKPVDYMRILNLIYKLYNKIDSLLNLESIDREFDQIVKRSLIICKMFLLSIKNLFIMDFGGKLMLRV